MEDRTFHQKGNGVAEGRVWGRYIALKLVSGQSCSVAFCLGTVGGRTRAWKQLPSPTPSIPAHAPRLCSSQRIVYVAVC